MLNHSRMPRKSKLSKEQIELSTKLGRLVLENKEDTDEFRETEYLFNKLALEDKYNYS
jgi:hypothetical protein